MTVFYPQTTPVYDSVNGTISGYLTNQDTTPAPGYTVVMFFDGSPTQLFSVMSAVNGHWSMPIGALSQEAHTYIIAIYAMQGVIEFQPPWKVVGECLT